VTTEEKIRRAAGRLGWDPSRTRMLISEMERNDHIHDFADDDTVTVKEVRDAATRLRPAGFPGVVIFPVEDLLKDISSHREPAYIPGRTYRGQDGEYYHRMTAGDWRRGSDGKLVPRNHPAKPLELMP
jgi:hypothetical protein